MNNINNNKSGLKKVKDYTKICTHPEHNPPSHIVLSPGEYEYTCPSCGKITKFTVPLITC
ncbi:MAG: hypothetical protein JETCAE03_31860 [Ignavibacteriaceae bacterium]|jgi:hypothetical protein|nr:MAG: hypothetical protein JETCAE03_31860 [Ignavibacteriaceae bacterium]